MTKTERKRTEKSEIKSKNMLRMNSEKWNEKGEKPKIYSSSKKDMKKLTNIDLLKVYI